MCGIRNCTISDNILHCFHISVVFWRIHRYVVNHRCMIGICGVFVCLMWVCVCVLDFYEVRAMPSSTLTDWAPRTPSCSGLGLDEVLELVVESWQPSPLHQLASCLNIICGQFQQVLFWNSSRSCLCMIIYGWVVLMTLYNNIKLLKIRSKKIRHWQ